MQTHIVFGDGTFVTLAEMTPDDLVAIFALALCGVGEAIDVLEAAPDREGWDRAGALNTRRDMQAKVDAFYAELQRVLAGPLCGCTNGWFITQDEEPQIERCDECKLIATDEDAAALPAAQEALREAQNAAPTTGVEHVCPWALRDPPAGPKLATCGICNRTWCEACEPTPSALCPWCHGMGFSKAPVRVKVWEAARPRGPQRRRRAAAVGRPRHRPGDDPHRVLRLGRHDADLQPQGPAGGRLRAWRLVRHAHPERPPVVRRRRQRRRLRRRLQLRARQRR